MLVRDDGLLVGQPAHAWVSGQIARAWGNAAFPAPAPREPVCLAAEQHDVGWQDADLEPLRGEDGRPLSFIEYPRPEHIAIWRDAARRLLAQSRYAALLVSLHGTSLYERSDPDAHPPEVAAMIRAYLRGERARQAELSAGLDPEEVARNRRLVAALDRLSLALCRGVPATLESVPGAGGPATMRVQHAAAARPLGVARDDHAVPPDSPTAHATLAPWPFAAEAVVVGCEARRLGDGGAIADWVPLRFALSPG